MPHHERALDQDLQKIQQLLISMGKKVQHMLSNSMKAFLERNARLAEEMIQFDKEIDKLELQIDQAIYEVIALRQPAAGDLRNVLASIKINNDLERMGDYCEGICRQSLTLNKSAPLKEAQDFVKLSEQVGRMVGDCIASYVTRDVELAKKVILADDEVDESTHNIFDRLQLAMKQDSQVIGPASSLLLVASKLERVADQATNICEEVVFTVTGDNIRHRSYIYAVGEDD